MIDRPTIAKIMDATKIEEVVSEFVTLKKRGINYVGLCPFHNDSNPSFSVSPTRGICHCFTCGKGGNAINFLMELEQMTYPDALRWLAQKSKIEIHERERTNEEKQRESERESMFIVNDWAAKYFQDILLHDVDGIAIGMAYSRLEKAMELYQSADDDLEKNFNRLIEGVNENFRKRNISMLEFVDYYESYKETSLQLYETRKDVFLAMENLNTVVGRNIFNY